MVCFMPGVTENHCDDLRFESCLFPYVTVVNQTPYSKNNNIYQQISSSEWSLFFGDKEPNHSEASYVVTGWIFQKDEFNRNNTGIIVSLYRVVGVALYFSK